VVWWGNGREGVVDSEGEDEAGVRDCSGGEGGNEGGYAVVSGVVRKERADLGERGDSSYR